MDNQWPWSMQPVYFDPVPFFDNGNTSATVSSSQVPASPGAMAGLGASPLTTPTFPAVLFSALIGGANELGRNVHKVRRKEMTPVEAVWKSLVRGASTSVATSTAIALTSSRLQDRTLATRLAAIAAATAGISFLISWKKPRKPLEREDTLFLNRTVPSGTIDNRPAIYCRGGIADEPPSPVRDDRQ